MKNIKDVFPEVIFDNTPEKQLDQILLEVIELEHEVKITKDRKNTLYEAIDIIHSTTSFLYMCGYTENEIYEGINDVREKNQKRGYYKTN